MIAKTSSIGNFVHFGSKRNQVVKVTGSSLVSHHFDGVLADDGGRELRRERPVAVQPRRDRTLLSVGT